jgi:holo-[acyl-carrier protein] synthase
MIGVGVDLVEVPRFREVINRTPSMLDRLFTDAERAYADRHRDPAPRLAVRFAAKEAVMKALGVGLGSMTIRDIEVARDEESGRPTLVLHDTARRVADDRGVTQWQISLTHTDLMAQAMVIAL